eukprot:3047010-Amphidinium_carterae.1
MPLSGSAIRPWVPCKVGCSSSDFDFGAVEATILRAGLSLKGPFRSTLLLYEEQEDFDKKLSDIEKLAKADDAKFPC